MPSLCEFLAKPESSEKGKEKMVQPKSNDDLEHGLCFGLGYELGCSRPYSVSIEAESLAIQKAKVGHVVSLDDKTLGK